MTWRSIYEIYNGIVGKSIFIISLAAPISFLVNYGIDTYLYLQCLTGAIIVAISYSIVIIKTPQTIKKFQDPHAFFQTIESIRKNDALDLVAEFKVLEDKRSFLFHGLDTSFIEIPQLNSIEALKEKLGEERSVRILALMKYNYINSTNKFARYGLTLSLIVGSALLYSPILIKICVIIKEGLK